MLRKVSFIFNILFEIYQTIITRKYYLLGGKSKPISVDIGKFLRLVMDLFVFTSWGLEILLCKAI